jgi:hypothetical protein
MAGVSQRPSESPETSMSYELDPELVPAMAALAAQAAEAKPPARGDWRAVRAAASAGLAYLASITRPSSG